MLYDIIQKDDKWKWPVIITEFVLLNIFVMIVWQFLGLHNLTKWLLTWNISYAFATLFCPPVVFHRSIRSEQIITSVIKVTFLMLFIFYALLIQLRFNKVKFLYYVVFSVCVFIIILSSRLIWHALMRKWRFLGIDNIKAVFVGSDVNLQSLYNDMTDDASMGYNIVGYFDDEPSDLYEDKMPLLGSINNVIDWLSKNKVNYLFCSLPSQHSVQIKRIINYCENHLIHFYTVPDVRNYIYHKMNALFFGSSIVLALRNEPMCTIQARFAKRTFDIVFSLIVIITILWWLTIIVAIITKITMPGPLFFKQKRNGLNNSEFYCLKFRTMVVNDDADNVQATKDDQRITKWGHFMRKTNLDEFPQFINVLRGEMSVVGPRPHMIKHNEEYRRLIDKYMVRFYSRPGITGWAQVTGSRGETKTIQDMEERIQKDIWYIENWTFMLDMRIILLTIANMFGGEKGNNY